MGNKLRLGLIRGITLINKEDVDNHARIIMEKYKGNKDVEIVSRCISGHHFGIYDNETLKQGVSKMMGIAKEFEDQEFDGIIISSCIDSKLEQIESNIKIPVISAGYESSCQAAESAKRIGAIGITEKMADSMKDILGSKLFKYIKPKKINNVVDLNADAGMLYVLETAYDLEDMGADSIFLCSTEMSNAGMAEVLRNEIYAPVIDPLEAVIKRIELL